MVRAHTGAFFYEFICWSLSHELIFMMEDGEECDNNLWCGRVDWNIWLYLWELSCSISHRLMHKHDAEQKSHKNIGQQQQKDNLVDSLNHIFFFIVRNFDSSIESWSFWAYWRDAINQVDFSHRANRVYRCEIFVSRYRAADMLMSCQNILLPILKFTNYSGLLLLGYKFLSLQFTLNTNLQEL